ncbi:MAG: PTS sugar transporter subunit IIA [Sphingomonadaceae bacterium]|nr:PTS sugar transporter subunit IIA [Sphingomonadaceae bacterium]
MSDLGDLIAPGGVVFDLAGTNKRAVLQTLSARAATLAGRDAAHVTRVILEREALGSTGFGAGTAIPHGRLDDLPGIVTVAAKLATPVDYAALDGLPVDLVVLMLAPTTAGAEPLKALARVSRALRDAALCGKLRGAASAEAFHAVLAGDRRIAA